MNHDNATQKLLEDTRAWVHAQPWYKGTKHESKTEHSHITEEGRRDYLALTGHEWQAKT